MNGVQYQAMVASMCFACSPLFADTATIERLSPESAAAIALKHQTGEVVENELEIVNGRPVFDIEVVTSAGDEVEFKVDAVTGEILRQWTDDDPSNDPGPEAVGSESESLTPLSVFATSEEFVMNGVTVTPGGRVFVSIPQWTDVPSPSVAEILDDGSIKAYPGNTWNEFDPSDPMNRFMNVNSVYSDGAGSLWAVDYAAPNFGPTIEGAQKLVQIDLATNEVVEVYRFDEEILPKGARLNDVRVDAKLRVAYLTEFGLGALIVVDLDSGEATRVLDRHYSTRAHPDVSTTFLGKPFKTDHLQVNDIELSPNGETLFYQATGGPVLWKIQTKWLRSMSENSALEPHIGVVGKSMTLGGMTRDASGQLFLGSVQDNAVWTMNPNTGETRRILQDDRLLWPDAMSVDSDGFLYIPAPQLRLLPGFNDGKDLTRGSFSVYRFNLNEVD